MSSNLELQKAVNKSAQQQVLGHFRFRVREQLRELTDKEFTDLAITWLHRNHHYILEEFLFQGIILAQAHSSKKEKRRAAYLAESHRKTITILLTSLEPDGYCAEIVEYLLANMLWRV